MQNSDDCTICQAIAEEQAIAAEHNSIEQERVLNLEIQNGAPQNVVELLADSADKAKSKSYEAYRNFSAILAECMAAIPPITTSPFPILGIDCSTLPDLTSRQVCEAAKTSIIKVPKGDLGNLKDRM